VINIFKYNIPYRIHGCKNVEEKYYKTLKTLENVQNFKKKVLKRNQNVQQIPRSGYTMPVTDEGVK